MNFRALLRIFLFFTLAFASLAVTAADNPYSSHARSMYSGVKQILLRSAEQVPEEHYAFKPTDAVRSFGQVVGHVADSQYLFCSIALGEKNPAPKIEQTRTTKADLVASLKEAFAYCDKAYNSITDASGVEMTKFHAMEMPKLGVLTVNTAHTMEHYGNLVTYMRLKNIVPPTSDQTFMKNLVVTK